MLTITTAADKTDFVTLADVLAHLVIPSDSGAQDARLTFLIAEASDCIRTHLDWEVVRQAYSLKTRGFGIEQISLGVPYVEPASIVVQLDGVTISDYVVDDSRASILYRSTGWPYTGILTGIPGDRKPSSEEPSIAATFRAGFMVPGQTVPADSNSRTLPDTIRRATVEAVKELWLRDQRDLSVITRASGGRSSSEYASITFSPSPPPEIEEILSPRVIASLKTFRCLSGEGRVFKESA